MIQRPLSKEEVWRERWKADIAARARQQVPMWLQELRKEALLSRPAIIPNPATPAPATADTAIIPITQLLAVDLRDTRELVSSAVKWFYARHHCLPSVVGLNPLRCLAISSQSFFPIDCEEIGGYTVKIQQAYLDCDEVWLCYEGVIEDQYLCVAQPFSRKQGCPYLPIHAYKTFHHRAFVGQGEGSFALAALLTTSNSIVYRAYSYQRIYVPLDKREKTRVFLEKIGEMGVRVALTRKACYPVLVLHSSVGRRDGEMLLPGRWL